MHRPLSSTPFLPVRWPVVCSIFVCGVLWPSSASARDHPAHGHWVGTLMFRQASMDVRLDFHDRGDGMEATLDIPGLLMAWEPIPATPGTEGVEVELPFGLGALDITVDGGLARGSKSLGDETVALTLVRTPEPGFSRELVEFESDGIRLVGTLALPDGGGPHPAMVLLHGSGRLGRHSWGYRSWADFLVRRGFAVLYYDKRGVGDSGGEYGADLGQLADDGVAAFEYLQARPEVDSERIGLHGWSQGAWLAEQVASDTGAADFLLLVSGAGGTPRDQELQQVEYGMRADGREEADIEDALAYLGLYFYVARTGTGWPLLETAAQLAQDREWGQYVSQPESEDDLTWWRDNMAFQPASVVGELRVPVLLLYGEADWITPPVENAERLASLFPVRDKVDVHVFPYADHRLEVPSGPDPAGGGWQWPRIAPGALDVVDQWLRELWR